MKKECLPGASGLDCPLLEEYDFANDTVRTACVHMWRTVVQVYAISRAALCVRMVGDLQCHLY